jgi:hypothetical protein
MSSADTPCRCRWTSVGCPIAGRGSGSGRAARAMPLGLEDGASRALCQRRHRPPYDAVASPQTGSPGGDTYARRYHDHEHVNESDDASLPVGVIPAAA